MTLDLQHYRDRHDMAKCDLCNQYSEASDMRLFRVKDKRLCTTDDRGWELKAGIRHLCRLCCYEIANQVMKNIPVNPS